MARAEIKVFFVKIKKEIVPALTWISFISSSFSSGLSAMVVILMGSLSGVLTVFCLERTPSVSGISFPPLAPGAAQALSL